MSPRTLIFTALAGCALAAGAYAAMPRAGVFAPPSSAELGLSGSQASQWETLRQETVALRDAVRSQAQARVGDFSGLLDQPAPDLRGFSRGLQNDVDATLANARSLRDRKLAFYESLPPATQAQVRSVMKVRLQQAQRMHGAVLTLLQETP